MVASGMSFEVGRYSQNSPTQRYVKKIAETWFLTLANPTLNTFFTRVYRGPLVQIECKQTPRLRQACRKMVEHPSRMSPGTTNLEE